jgi:hypothetical protein
VALRVRVREHARLQQLVIAVVDTCKLLRESTSA